MPKRDSQLPLVAPLPVAELGEAERIACLRLIRSDNVGPVTFRELINHYGSAQAALAAVPELSRRSGRAIRICTRETAEAELDRARKAGAQPLFTIEPGYPMALAVLDAPPPLLYVKGRTELLNRRNRRRRRLAPVLGGRRQAGTPLRSRAVARRLRGRLGACPRHRLRRA